ncbi:MAG: LD-carboxypeptidase [Halobacteriaceae archaeon]
MPDFEVPPALSPGDEVAVIAPSSGGARDAPQVLSVGLKRLRETFDLRPRVHPTARQSNEFLAAHPRARAAAIHEAFRDPDIGAVFATIGGHDQLGVLKHLDPTVLENHPTRFFGMSDNTNLQLYLWRLGQVSFNGAQVMNELGVPGRLPAYTAEYCRRAFFDHSLGSWRPSEAWTDEPPSWGDREGVGERQEFVPNPGWRFEGGARRVSGRIWGGNLSIVHWQLAANRYLPAPRALNGSILAIEIAEDLPAPSQIRAQLMCMGERGLLERFDGVLVGRTPGRSFRESPPAKARAAYRNEVAATIVDVVGRYTPDAPVALGLD